MGPDLPEEADVPPDGHVDRRDDQTGSGRTARPGNTEAETRSHEECYNDLRVAEAKEKSITAQRIAAEEQAAVDTWNEKVKESRWMWTEYQRRWPPWSRVKRPLLVRLMGYCLLLGSRKLGPRVSRPAHYAVKRGQYTLTVFCRHLLGESLYFRRQAGVVGGR